MRATRKLKIVSNNKVRANRENAKKSTGPRTVSGKEKVSGNALSHGLTAEKHVIIGESIEEFNTFKDSMFKVYEHFGAYEEEIFIKLVELLWRLRRVVSLKQEFMEMKFWNMMQTLINLKPQIK